MDVGLYRRAGVERLRDALRSGSCRSVDLVDCFTETVQAIDGGGPQIRSVLQTNPEAWQISADLDEEITKGHDRGPLHGVPVLLKDNIDTADALNTTAGSLALLDSRPTADAPLTTALRAAGAVIVGKANMTEWANFRSTYAVSGWSARGGLVRNPHALDRSAGGSSSGSAAAVAAGLVPIAVGTETDGSILCPASFNGIVGLKPTIGLISGRGVIPISNGQDTAGPMARSVIDVALLLDAMGEPTASTYAASADPAAARAVRIGVPDPQCWGPHPVVLQMFEDTMNQVAAAGVPVVRGVRIPSLDQAEQATAAEHTRLLYDLKWDMQIYLANRVGDGPRTLADLIAFNDHAAAIELEHFGQDLFIAAQSKGDRTEPEYLMAVAVAVENGGASGIDAACHSANVHLIAAPCYEPATKIDLLNGNLQPRYRKPSLVGLAARAGYPGITVPIGTRGGLPVGIVLVGPRNTEPALIAAASLIEQLRGGSPEPTFKIPSVG